MDSGENPDANVITLDGPAGSGKSTVARLLAARLGYRFLDTGAMYRAATLAALEAGVADEPLDEDAVVAALDAAGMSLDPAGAVLLGGRPVEPRIRTQEVTERVSAISALPRVRERLTRMQREFAARARPGLVAEGRDMATVVFPRAPHRFYLDARIDVRAARRQKERARRGLAPRTLEQEIEAIERRDEKDASRDNAPLRLGPGVERIDTSDLTVEQVVDLLERKVARREVAG